MLDKELLKDIRTEILASYEIEELQGFRSFEEFWDAEDVRNGYEEGWEESKDKYLPYYKLLWEEFRPNSVKYIQGSA